MEINLPPLSEQKKIAEELEKQRAENRELKIEVCGLTSENLSRYDGGYQKPDVHVLRSMVAKTGLKRSEAALYMGFKTRQLRRYLNDPPESEIPYASVRLLLHKLGVIDSPTFGLPDGVNISSATLLEYKDDNYQAPSGDEFKGLCEALRLSVYSAADFLGVSDRTIKKWRAGTPNIAYGPWRLLLIECGLAEA